MCSRALGSLAVGGSRRIVGELVLAAALLAGAPLGTLGAPHEACAATEDDLSVGTELVAVTDVSLHHAVIGRGSRARVAKVSHSSGRMTSVDLELADGHVVPRVAIAMIRTSFRVAEPS